MKQKGGGELFVVSPCAVANVKFRARLLAAYDNKCCMTGTAATDVLEAAHIQPYSDLGTNSVTNGLLLRSDLHVLFDLFMISVDPESRLIYCSERIRSVTPYVLLGRADGPDPQGQP
jgi:predicted restriction endonuclease